MHCAVVLSGCGYLDGAEVFESVLTLLALERRGASYTCFAPDREQMHVVNHLTGDVVEGASRNVLQEAGRIVRGEIRPLKELVVDEFDALLLPGGYGAAKNLSSFATQGRDMTLNAELFNACVGFADAGKPAGYICIAPTMITKVYGKGTRCTIGHDESTAAEITAMGGDHQDCPVDDIVVDEQRKVVSTPAYMLAQSVLDAEKGISKLVNRVLDFVPG